MEEYVARPLTHHHRLTPSPVRLALNYKGIDYETQWIEYPDLEPKFSKTHDPPSPFPPSPNKKRNPPNKTPHSNLAPNPSKPLYTIPAIALPNGTLVQDSNLIAPALETLHPAPSLRFNDPLTAKVQSAVTKVHKALVPLVMPLIATQLLNPRSAEYFSRTRAVRFGKPLTELAADEEADPRAWRDAEEGIAELKRLLALNEGVFFLGGEVAYVDFVFVAALKFWQRVDLGLFREVVGRDEAFGRLWEACREWVGRDD